MTETQSKPETLGKIIAERVQELTGKIPVHKLNRRQRRIYLRQTGIKVLGSQVPNKRSKK